MKDRGKWLGVVVGAVGWLLTALVLVRGGGYFVVVPHLAFVLPLAVVGTVTALACFGVGRRSLNAVVWLAVVAVAGFAWNFLVYWLRFGADTWGLLLPLAKPTGFDFRLGLYDGAAAFSTAYDGWPPLTLILGWPFTLLDISTAYAVQVGVLAGLAVAAAVLSAKLALKAACDPDLSGQGRRIDAKQLAVVLGFWLMTSYGFMYEVERGNIDLYTLFFALLSVWLMLRLPRSAWWPAVALAVAINLKFYPGVLLVLLFWRYRWRAVVPVVVANVAFLLIGGPGNVRNTVTALTDNELTTRALWWGNHSAGAMAQVLRDVTGWAPSWVYVPLLLVPLALWLVTIVLLVRRGWSDRRAVLAAAACVPIMGVVPAISHDYKLVLYVFPLAVLAAAIATMRRRNLLMWSLLFGLLSLAMLFLSRSSLVIAPSLVASKYALLVLVQLLLLYVSWLPEEGAVEPTPAAGGDSVAAPAPGSAKPGAATRLTAWFTARGPDAAEEDGEAGAPTESACAAAPHDATAARPAARPLAWPTRRMVCVVLLILAAVLGANFWVGIIGNTFNDLSSGVGVPQHDFFQYYAGGHNWNLGVDPYVNHPHDARVMHQPRPNYPEISGYIYPPTLLPLFGALSRADYESARTIWLVLNVSAFALLVLVAVAVSRGRRLEVLTAAVLLTMVSFAFFYHVHEGQIDMIIAALSISAFLLYPRWRGWPSAALLAVAVAMKVSPIILVAVIALFFRDWRFLLKTLACGIVVFAASLAFVDFALYPEYFGKILPTIAGSDGSPFNQTPLRFWWKHPLVIKIGSALGYAALFFLTWVAGRNARRVTDTERLVDRRTERNAMLLLAVVLTLLFSPLAWQMAYVWVIVPLALVLTAAPPRGKEWAVLVLALGAALLSMRIWPYRVLDMTNIIGAAITALCVMRYYLPLEMEKLRPDTRATLRP